MKAIKGFDADLKCRGFQFEVGKTYKHEGEVKACHGGFHAVPEDVHPLAVFGFYAPAGSRFCRVEVDGKTYSATDKVAAEILSVKEEISLGDLAHEAVAWVMARAKHEGEVASKMNGLATASGTRGAATASGYFGKVKGALGNAIFAVERETWDGTIISVACGIVGKEGIKANTWYRAVSGRMVEVSQ